MAWYSILPADLTYLETWAARFFFILGLITLIPWAAILFFDIGLYICRMVLYEIPLIGGRARGAERPRVPSFGERLDDGQRRPFDFSGDDGDGVGDGGEDIMGDGEINGKGWRVDEKENIKGKDDSGKIQ